MSLVLTLAQNFRVQTPKYDKFEFRAMEAGMFDTFKRQSEGAASWVTPELKERAFASIGRTLKIPAINYKDVTIRSTRPTTISADENTSALVSVSFTTYAYGFKMYPAQHLNNEVSYQQDFNKKMDAFIVKILSTLESAAITAVDAVKNQVEPELVGGHSFSSNVVHETGLSALADSYIIGDLDPLQRSNDFQPFLMDVVGNQGLNAVLKRMDGFGGFNQENKTLQYDSKNFHFSNSISNASGKSATGYAIQDGSLGIVTRVERDSLSNTKSRTGHEWGTLVLPGIGLQVGTYYYEEVADANTVAGAATSDLTRTKVETFDFAVDVAFLVPYNSAIATIPSPILKFDIQTS